MSYQNKRFAISYNKLNSTVTSLGEVFNVLHTGELQELDFRNQINNFIDEVVN